MGRRGGKFSKASQYHQIIYQITRLVTLNQKYIECNLFDVFLPSYDEQCLQINTPVTKLNDQCSHHTSR